jgi:hypothetical protein
MILTLIDTIAPAMLLKRIAAEAGLRHSNMQYRSNAFAIVLG